MLQREREEALRLRLLLGELREPLHPALERQAQAHQVAREQVAEADEAAARIPQPGQRHEQHRDPNSVCASASG